MIENIAETLDGRAFLHGPIRDGQCSPCHSVHGASYSRLLNERFTEAFYAPYDLKNYALCFDCHVQNLVQDERDHGAHRFPRRRSKPPLRPCPSGSQGPHVPHLPRDPRQRSAAAHRGRGSVRGLGLGPADPLREAGERRELLAGLPRADGVSTGPRRA
jgi:predicted CXXCH cytochrome family protein